MRKPIMLLLIGVATFILGIFIIYPTFSELLGYIIFGIIASIFVGISLIFKFFWERLGIAIFGILIGIALIGVLICSLVSPDAPLRRDFNVFGVVLQLIGLITIVAGTIMFGLEHPSRNVKDYAVICAIWEIFFLLISGGFGNSLYFSFEFYRRSSSFNTICVFDACLTPFIRYLGR